jgi:hypothetical protein
MQMIVGSDAALEAYREDGANMTPGSSLASSRALPLIGISAYSQQATLARQVYFGRGAGSGGTEGPGPGLASPSMTGLGFQKSFTPHEPDDELAGGGSGPPGANGYPDAETIRTRRGRTSGAQARSAALIRSTTCATTTPPRVV